MDYYEQKELWDRELTNQEIERIDIIKKFIKTYDKDDLLVRNNHMHFIYI